MISEKACSLCGMRWVCEHVFPNGYDASVSFRPNDDYQPVEYKNDMCWNCIAYANQQADFDVVLETCGVE